MQSYVTQTMARQQQYYQTYNPQAYQAQSFMF